LLTSLTARSTVWWQCSDGERIKNYFDIACVAYGGFGVAHQFEPGGAPITASQLRSQAKWEQRRRKIPDGAGGLVEVEADFPVWLTPVANGGTPMALGLRGATDVADRWAADHQGSFPPIVIHITDGEPDDASSAERAANDLRDVSTSDGDALLFNSHISERSAAGIAFPVSDAGLPDEFARLLFRMSSVLPAVMLTRARVMSIRTGARAFAYNADQVRLIEFLEVGTRLDILLTSRE
jgi:hypothetical protein